MKKRDHVPAEVLRRTLPLQRSELARRRATRKPATAAPADVWLNQLIHQSPAFQAQVDEELAAINVAQDLVALRESRGVSQSQLADRLGMTRSAIAQLESAQPKNVELRTLVRVATALGAHVDPALSSSPT